MKVKREVAAFDFDGTLTSCDTLIEFIIFTHGRFPCYLGLMLFSPLIFLMKLHIISNWRVKQWFFAWFYKDMEYIRFAEQGAKFAASIEGFHNKPIMRILQDMITAGFDVYVVSASVEEWVRPFCIRQGVKDVLCTKIEVRKDGTLSGKFLTKNCYGQEKVNRLLMVEPDRSDYYLYAFGDSQGDKELLRFADKGINIKRLRS